MSDKLEPGNYVATVANYSIGQFETGNKFPFVSIQFKLKDHAKSVFYKQALTVKTQGFTVETLVETGLLRTKKFSDIAKGVDGGALSTDTEVSLALAYDDSGDYLNVQYINKIGGGAMKGALAASEAINVLAGAGLSLDAEILASEQKTGIRIEVAPVNQVHEEVAADMIPF